MATRRLSFDFEIGGLTLDGKHFAGRSSLGGFVETNQDGTQCGRIKTVQYNPREGQCFPAPEAASSTFLLAKVV